MVDFETAARKVAASHPILFLRKFFFRSLLWKLVFTRSISINVRSFNYKRLLIKLSIFVKKKLSLSMNEVLRCPFANTNPAFLAFFA